MNYNIVSKNSSCLIKASSRICPIAQVNKDEDLSCPQGELTACLLGARVAKYIQGQLFNHKLVVNFWTDSEVVLRWFTKVKLKPFERKLLAELKELASVEQYHYCPSPVNPADINCRGVDFDSWLMKRELWFHGPEFLLLDEIHWPKPNFDMSSIVVDEPLVQIMPILAQNTDISHILNIDDFSDVNRLLRVTAYILRASKAFR